MLLGVVFHAAGAYDLSVGAWPIQDVSRHIVWDWLGSLLHGFRMPLFFAMSGFFAALLIQRRGTLGFLRNRTLRILVPFLICMVVLIPINLVVWIGLGQIGALDRLQAADPQESIWAAAAHNDVQWVQTHLDQGVPVDLLHDYIASSALVLAVCYDHAEVAEVLLQRGADVNLHNRDGTRPLHAAVVFGNAGLVKRLLDAGADPHLTNGLGRSAREMLGVHPAYGTVIAQVMGIADPTEKRAGVGPEIERTLLQAERSVGPSSAADEPPPLDLLRQPTLIHLWFLWFLVIYTVVLAALSSVGRKWVLQPSRIQPWITGWRLWVWLLPATALPTAFMVDGYFGPDGSVSVIPRWHVLALYAIYYGFGALYFAADDQEGRFAKRWPLALLGAMLVLPIGIATTPQTALGTPAVWASGLNHAIWVASSTLYSWLMIVGLMGAARQYLSRERPTIRYLSDAAYWIYLIHILLLLGLGWAMQSWAVSSLLKMIIACGTTALVGLLTYHYCVRYTAIGSVLNGPRFRAPSAAQ